MRVVYITGIAGFIGFHLALKLKEVGCFVYGCDDFNNAYSVDLKRQRAEILKQKGVEVHEFCISSRAAHRVLFKKNPPTHVIHLAAQAGVRASIDHPDIFIKTNVQGFVDILEVLKEFKPKFLYASSSSVYGDNKEYPSSENHKTDAPLSLYGATKKSNELMAFAYHKIYGIPMIGLRFFTCYGPYGRPDMAIYLFTDKIYHGKPITVYGEGKMERDFTYVDDIVKGIMAAMEYQTSFDIFNLGKGKTDNLLHLIDVIERGLNKKAIIDFQPRPEVDPIKNCADVSKAQNLLGYTPSTPIEVGIEHFINWYILK